MAATSTFFIPALLQVTDTKQEQTTAVKLFASVNELSMKYDITLEALSMLSDGAFAFKAYWHDGTEAWKG